MLQPSQELVLPRRRLLLPGRERWSPPRLASPLGRTSVGVNSWAYEQSPIGPLQVTSATLKYWFDQGSYTIAGSMLHTAGTGPVVTLTGTLQQALQITVRITLGGARGTATYAVDLNATANYQTGTTAATVALAGTGIALNFPSTPNYVATDVYKAVCSSLVDKVIPTTNNLTNGTVPQRPIITFAGTGGNPTCAYDGVDDRLFNTTAAAWGAVYGGLNQPFTVLWIENLLSNPGNVTTMWSAGNLTDANLPGVFFQKNGATNYQLQRRVTASDFATVSTQIFPTTEAMFWLWRFDGTHTRLRANGIDVIGGDSLVDGTQTTTGSITINQFCVGAQKTSSTTNFCNLNLGEMAGFQGAVSDTDMFGLEAFYMS